MPFGAFITHESSMMDSDESRPPAAQQQDIAPLLVRAKTAAQMCGKSLRTWRTWDAAGISKCICKPFGTLGSKGIGPLLGSPAIATC